MKRLPGRYLIVFLIVLFQYSTSSAQLTADFITDKAGGCSPLTLQLTNTTTGASANANWNWDFGNGNTSVEKNPAAVFIGAKSYTITLTVKDGDKVSVKTKSVTVYAKPEIDFSFDPPQGCMPLEVNFTAQQKGGDGKVSAWTWDFGDGSTFTDSVNTTKHTYHFRQSASVSLTALSFHGCASSVTKDGIISVKDSASADFQADHTILCDADARVSFTNKSTGSGNLTYQWDFGDGSRSTAASPVHTYKKNGKYTVSLTVTSSEGCSVSSIKNEYISVGNMVTDFVVPGLMCEKSEIRFKNISYPKPLKSSWLIDDKLIRITIDSFLIHEFASSGVYTIKLINHFGSCTQEITKQVNIKVRPLQGKFLMEHPDFCTPPVEVKFRDTTPGVVKWRWNLQYVPGTDTVHSTLQETSYKYSYPYGFVKLEVENAEGCTSSYVRNLNLESTRVSIKHTDTLPLRSCISVTKGFKAVSTDSIINYFWEFGDGGTSTEAYPIHTYKKPGQYSPVLTYTTVHGCTGRLEEHAYIQVLGIPKLDFQVPAEVCGSDYVYLINNSTGSIYRTIVDWGDGSPPDYIGTHHRYQKPGEYTITMVAENDLCNDTLTRKNIIKVSGPIARINQPGYSCEGDRNEVIFNDSSIQAKKWTWDFGDGNKESYNLYKPSVKHRFDKTGNYWVSLHVENEHCTQKDSVLVHILKKQKPILNFERDNICLQDNNAYQIRNLEENDFIYSNYAYKYTFKTLELKSGQVFSGEHYHQSWTWIRDLDGEVIPSKVVDDSIRIIITSRFHGCDDTTNFIPFKVRGVSAAFEVLKENYCLKEPVVFNDNSKIMGGDPIVSRHWSFGDGTTVLHTNSTNVKHVYNEPGHYYAKLTVTDSVGCSSSAVTLYPTPIRIIGAKAAFYVSPGTVVEERSEVNFNNLTYTGFATGTVNYKWYFGDGYTSVEENPVHSYQKAGIYTILLLARDTDSGCTDTSRLTITVTDVPSQNAFRTSIFLLGDNGSCPPVRASAFFLSNMPYTRLVWDFGDGFTLEDQSDPSHIYTKPGTYIITLKVFDGTVNTGTYKDTIAVGVPPALLAAGDNTLCKGDEFSMFAPFKKSGYTYTWDFGNGSVKSGTDSLVNYRYNHPGTFQPSLIVRDKAGCAAAVTLAEQVTVYPEPVIIIDPVSAMVCKDSGVQLTASGGFQYLWTPKAGLSADDIANPMASPVSNTIYSVIGTDNNGCSSTSTIQLTVAPLIHIQTVSSIEICKGEEVRLNVTGATGYQWTGDVNGLSNTGIANPVARPDQTTSYTVVGTDPNNCYRDTAEITVHVRPLPTVILGQDQEVATGTPVTLQSTASADVVRWEWSPSTYLNCSNCPAPVSTPLSDITYALTVSNSYQCKAIDTIIIKTLCSGNKIHIPNTFTPNGDGLNDVFRIPANGIRRISYLRIYNSWGEIIFEHRNFAPGDPAGSWTGKLKGLDLPAGTYVYATEVECSPEKKFAFKGTVTLLR